MKRRLIITHDVIHYSKNTKNIILEMTPIIMPVSVIRLKWNPKIRQSLEFLKGIFFLFLKQFSSICNIYKAFFRFLLSINIVLEDVYLVQLLNVYLLVFKAFIKCLCGIFICKYMHISIILFLIYKLFFSFQRS